MNEARVEHASAKQLIAELTDADATDDMFDAKVKVLGEYVHQPRHRGREGDVPRMP